MAEEKKMSASSRRYGGKEKAMPEKERKEGSAREERTEPKAEAKAEGDDMGDSGMSDRHMADRKDMRSRQEKEHRDLHGQHREAMRKMASRHEQEMSAMNAKQEGEMGGGAATGTPGADADQMPNAGMSQGAEV